MARKWAAWMLCLLMAAGCACAALGEAPAGAGRETGDGSAPQATQVTDMRGRAVSIPADARRFACIGPGCLRLYCYVADESKLAGVEQVEITWGETGRPYRMALENMEAYAILGPGGPGNAPDAEMLFTAAPDVIFCCYAMENAELDALQEKIMTPVVALSYGEARLFSPEVNKSLRLIGQVTGNAERAEAVIAYFEASREDLMERTAGVETPVRAYVGCLSYQGAHGIESTTGDYPMLDVLHAENVVATAGIDRYATLDKERLMDMDPEVILVDAGGLSILREDYAANPDFYRTLSAVQNGRLYLQMPFNYYDTNIEIALADAYYIGTALYPEAFADVDPAAKFDEITMELLGVAAYDRIAATYYGGYQTITLEE